VAKALTEARQELLDFALLRLQRAVSRSVRKIAHLVDSPDEGVALKASLAVIDRSLTMAQHLGLVERVRSLEDFRSEEESK
jgi:hypothetical protein